MTYDSNEAIFKVYSLISSLEFTQHPMGLHYLNLYKSNNADWSTPYSRIMKDTPTEI